MYDVYPSYKGMPILNISNLLIIYWPRLVIIGDQQQIILYVKLQNYRKSLVFMFFIDKYREDISIFSTTLKFTFLIK